MLKSEDTEQGDLRGGTAPWRQHFSRPPRPPLDADIKCDVVIVGAGITGSLMAEHLTSRHHDVCVIDRERPGMGSTAASTAMLQWEIDRPLRELASFYGFERAAAIYHHSLSAASGLIALIGELGIPCALRPRHSIYLAAGDVGAATLLDEHEMRRKAKLPGELIAYRELLGEFGFSREAAIMSPGSADADPLRMAQGLLDIAVTRGAKIYDAEAAEYHSGPREAVVVLDNGRAIAANHIVLATGYAMPAFVKPRIHSIASSWAIATAPQPPEALWRDGMLIWEASTQYHYARTTVDGRIIIGGEDDDGVTDPEARNRQIPAKSAALSHALKALRPTANAAVDFAWSGAFGKTDDGLPLIGSIPQYPRIHAAYGYGGNGITFSYLASRMVARMIAGDREEWFDDFAFDRDG